jgi:hypothetical protein
MRKKKFLTQKKKCFTQQIHIKNISPPAQQINFFLVLDTEYYPYPRFWIKTYHLRPSVTLLIENCSSNLNNLIVLAVPVDPETCQPLSNARLESAAEVINEELTNELQPRYGCPAVRFADMKVSLSDGDHRLILGR